MVPVEPWIKYFSILIRSAHAAIYPIHGDFYELPRYPVLAYRSPSDTRTRVWVFIGNTLGNLVDELRFFADLDACARPGDFALVHVQVVWAPAQDLDEVRRADPVIRKGIPELLARWLTGPVHRHCRGLGSVSASVDVTNRCPIPGSYELQFIGNVTMQDGSKRRFMLGRGRRYDAKMFAAALSDLGWKPLSVLPFGPEPPRCALLLLRRT